MNPLLERSLRLLGVDLTRPGHMLGGFVDSLLQTFENSRAGLTDEVLRSDADDVSPFFVELYEKEQPRLLDVVLQQERYLDEKARQELIERVDDRIRKVVIPAYVRLASRFTRRERNDFYLAPEGMHGLERLLWAVAGMGLGAFAVWAPFIPVWEKEWILPFILAGLVFPNIRRFFALRRYQAELNALVARTDDEIWRMDLNYLTGGMTAAQREEAQLAGGPSDGDVDPAQRERAKLKARLEDAQRSAAARAPSARRRHKEGGR